MSALRPQLATPTTFAWLICVGRRALLADRDRLVDALEQLRRVVALMGLVHAAEAAGRLRELDHLARSA